MSTPGLTGPSEARVVIDNNYLETAPAGSIIDVVNLLPKEAFMRIKDARTLPKAGKNGRFEPRGISINFVSDGAGGLDSDATLGIVNMQGKNEPYFFPQRLAVGVMHPIRVKAIKVGGTTARGIIIHQ